MSGRGSGGEGLLYALCEDREPRWWGSASASNFTCDLTRHVKPACKQKDSSEWTIVDARDLLPNSPTEDEVEAEEVLRGRHGSAFSTLLRALRK